MRVPIALLAGSAILAAMTAGCAQPLEHGERLYRQGDLRGALDAWNAVPPRDASYVQSQARAERVRDELERSFRLYEKRGQFYEREGRMAEALLHYRLALKLDPSRRALMDRVQRMVRVLAKRKQEERALLVQALERGELVTASRHAGALENLDPFDPAVQLEVREVRATLSNELLRHVQAGKALYASGAHVQAEREFKAVLALDEDNEEALGYLYYIRALERPDASSPIVSAEELPEISARSRLVTQEDILAAGHYRSAVGAEREGDVYWAIQQYEATLRVRPEHSQARRRLASLRESLIPKVEALDEEGKRYFREEDVQNALVMWNRVLLIDPSRERTRRNVEDARKILSRLEEIQAGD